MAETSHQLLRRPAALSRQGGAPCDAGPVGGHDRKRPRCGAYANEHQLAMAFDVMLKDHADVRLYGAAGCIRGAPSRTITAKGKARPPRLRSYPPHRAPGAIRYSFTVGFPRINGVGKLVSQRGKWPPGLVVLVGLCMVATGCGGSPSGSSTAPSQPVSVSTTTGPITAGQSHTTTPPRAPGAPTAFVTSKGVKLPPAASSSMNLAGFENTPTPVALAGPIAFVATGASLQVVDAISGRVIGDVPAGHSVINASTSLQSGYIDGTPPPYVVSLDGRQVALVGYVVTLPGRGTTPPELAVEIDAVDTQAKRLWSIVAPVPVQPSSVLNGPATATFVGSSGAEVVVSVSDNSGNQYPALAFDLVTQRLLWSKSTFGPIAVADGVVVGTVNSLSPAYGAQAGGTTGELAGLSLQAGATVWSRNAPVAVKGWQASASTVLIEALDTNTAPETGVLALLNASTGTQKVLETFDQTQLPWICQFDGQTTDVCGQPAGIDDDLYIGQRVFAVDGSTGRFLWMLPDQSANRIAPTVTDVYDGEAYGGTANGALVLNARTGKDVNDSVGIMPLVVNPYVGIAYNEAAKTMEAYPSSG